jgi:hypothetical protein
MLFSFPPDARWNPGRAVVEFSIGVGEYEGGAHSSTRFPNAASGRPDASTLPRMLSR